jgi:FixJ family two-component response regulator
MSILKPSRMRVLKVLAEGKTNPQIAEELGLSIRTVEVYVMEIYEEFFLKSGECDQRVSAARIYWTEKERESNEDRSTRTERLEESGVEEEGKVHHGVAR